MQKKLTKKNNIQQSGAGIFKTNEKKYSNLRYDNSSYSIPELHCMMCQGDIFKRRTLTMGTKAKEFFNAEFLDHRYHVFTCTKCGLCQLFSNKVNYTRENDIKKTTRRTQRR